MMLLANPKVAVYSRWIRYMASDSRTLATHVSLFTALFVCWQRSDFNNPFQVNRRELMSLSKIASFATYHKCMKELDDFGYLSYHPSYHPKNGSLVLLATGMPRFMTST